MGYKFTFKNNDGTYKNNTSFKDIYSLYIFDKMLKLAILDPILEIEQKLKTIYTNNYSSRYGFKIDDISNNYLSDTLSNLSKQLNDFEIKNKAVMFYRNNHSFIPLRVRNICCHDDILLSFVDDKLGIKTTKYYNRFNLKKDRVYKKFCVNGI